MQAGLGNLPGSSEGALLRMRVAPSMEDEAFARYRRHDLSKKGNVRIVFCGQRSAFLVPSSRVGAGNSVLFTRWRFY